MREKISIYQSKLIFFIYYIILIIYFLLKLQIQLILPLLSDFLEKSNS